MSELKPHKFAELLPMMSATDYGALKADVIGNGKFNEPAVEFQSQMLDGRNRQQVAKETGIKLPIIKFKGTEAEALAYVYSKAVHRNLGDSQKAAAAVNFLPHYEAIAKQKMSAGGKGREKVPTPSRARDDAGGLFGVSGRYVDDARRIKEADPKMFREVFEGRETVSRAKRLIHRASHRKVHKTVAGHVVNPDDCQILTGEFLKESAKLAGRLFRLIFIDPPYNLRFKYHGDPTHDNLPPAEYSKLTYAWIAECARLLTPDGTLCWMVPEEHIGLVSAAIAAAGMHMRRVIVWHESFGQTGQTNFGRTCRFIFYATKSKSEFIFNAGAVLIPSDRLSKYGDSWRALPDGKVPDALWDVSRVCGTFHERIKDEGLPTQLPIELVKRCVKCFTDPGDTVFDGMGGSGTTSRAALSLGRKCVTIDRSRKYTDIIRRELLAMGKAES